jgi:crotonobetainyl-CoA:carnitine CoA-transferase CaiB-like acyl-CoA transferase
VSAASRAKNAAACVAEIDGEFAKRTLADAVKMLDDQQGPWAVHQLPLEVFDDIQIAANGYIQPVEAGDGSTFRLIANPVQFDEEPAHLRRAPEHGEHTEQVLLEAGHTWEDLAAWKDNEVIS